MHQRPGNRHALQLPAAELLRQALAQALQTDGHQQRLHPGVIGFIQQ